jgi:hypothetical protein
MAKFMAVHTLPGYTEEKMAATAKQMVSNIPQGFSWKLTYCAFDQNKYFCEWDAPSKEALEQGFKQMKMPFDAVYPVKQFNVSKGSFEA